MQKLEVVQILMQKILSNLNFVLGNMTTLEKMPTLKALRAFSQEILVLLEAYAKLLQSKAKRDPALISLAFWLRKSNLQRMKEKYGTSLDRRLGLGLSFHSTPSNMPLNFMYSMVAAALAGNACIVRLPRDDFEQTNLAVEVFKECLEGFLSLKDYFLFVRYNSDPALNQFFSKNCDVRLIWGSDDTVLRFRQAPIPARAKDLVFANRYSLCVIDLKALQNLETFKTLAVDFYNDTYLNDQNACSSPVMVVWLNKDIPQDKALKLKQAFWDQVKLKASKYKIVANISAQKLTQAYAYLALHEGVKLFCDENVIYRLVLNKLDQDFLEFKYHSGFFFEYECQDLTTLIPLFAKGCQTLSYFGIDKQDLVNLILQNGVRGVDHIVPLGHSLDFSLNWDGYDLIFELSRVVDAW